jgi:hypothetical protein
MPGGVGKTLENFGVASCWTKILSQNIIIMEWNATHSAMFIVYSVEWLIRNGHGVTYCLSIYIKRLKKTMKNLSQDR